MNIYTCNTIFGLCLSFVIYNQGNLDKFHGWAAAGGCLAWVTSSIIHQLALALLLGSYSTCELIDFHFFHFIFLSDLFHLCPTDLRNSAKRSEQTRHCGWLCPLTWPGGPHSAEGKWTNCLFGHNKTGPDTLHTTPQHTAVGWDI